MNTEKLKIDDVVEKLRRLFPDNPGQVSDDISARLKTIVSAGLKNMDLVTREDFDVQSRLLARTRARLEELQARLDSLEQSGK